MSEEERVQRANQERPEPGSRGANLSEILPPIADAPVVRMTKSVADAPSLG